VEYHRQASLCYSYPRTEGLACLHELAVTAGPMITPHASPGEARVCHQHTSSDPGPVSLLTQLAGGHGHHLVFCTGVRLPAPTEPPAAAHAVSA
jgi:hypothetical protein